MITRKSTRRKFRRKQLVVNHMTQYSRWSDQNMAARKTRFSMLSFIPAVKMAFLCSNSLILTSQVLSVRSAMPRWQATNLIEIILSLPFCRATPRLATRPLSEWSTRRCKTKKATCLGRSHWLCLLLQIMGRETSAKTLPLSSTELKCYNSRQVTTNNSVLWDPKVRALVMLMDPVQIISNRCMRQIILWPWLNSSRIRAQIQRIVRNLSSSTAASCQT